MDALSVGVGALAAATGVARAIGMFRRNVNGAMFTRIALEQINKGSVDRVRRVCQAVPNTSYPTIAQAAIEATTMCDAEHGRNSVEQTIRDAFDHAYREEMLSASAWSWLAPASIALGVLAVVLAVNAPFDSIELAFIPAVLGALSGAWSMVLFRRLRTDPIELGDSIVEALVDYVMRATGDPAMPRDPDDEAERISTGLGLRPIGDLGERTVPAGVTTIAATATRTLSRSKSGVFDMRRGNCGMCGHPDVAIMERGPLKAYVCKGCGFAQWFADDPSSLDG